MLAERKKRVKWSLNPRGNLWCQDANKFGQRMLEKMGWKPGCGLGANEQGITENIKVTYKSDNKCIGYKEHGEEWIEQQSQFESLLAELGDSHDTTVSDNGDKGNESLELRSRQSRSRVHYQKFTRGKDISKYSDKDLACILGVKKTCDIADYSTVTEETNVVDNSIGNADNLYGVMTVNGGSMNIYFSKKKQKNVDSALEENHEEREQVGLNLVDNVCEAKTERKRKQKHEHSEGLCIQQTEVDGQEREGNELALKKKKRKLKDGDNLLKEDERINDGETHTKLNGEKDVYNSQAGNNSYEHEPITKRKKKQKEDCINIVGTHGNEVGQETDGLNYKKKKRKFKVEAEEQENLPMEAGAMKEDGRICGEASNNEQYIEEYSCEVGYESCVQEPKINSKEKQKQKDNEGPDAHEDEPITKSKKKRKEKDIQNLDTHRHEVGLETDGNNANGNSANSLNYKKKKRKLKVEVEEQENLPKEDEAIKRDGRICGEDSNNEQHIEKDKVYDSCVLKTKGNGKKKRKQKDNEGPDVDETRMTLLNGNSATDLRSKKKKRKIKERMENENSVNQTGNECIPGPTANEIEEISDHKNDKSNKIKKIKKSVDIDTEEAVYHSEMNDNEFLEKETTKHKINGVQNSNKKKKIKKNKDVTTCNSQEHYGPVQCNVEEPHAEASLVIGEASISINCENDAGKRKKKKGKTMYETYAGERIEEQDTEMNQHKSESTVENNEFLNEIKDFRNVEGSSKKVKNNCKQKQDVCNSDTQNSAGANFRTAGIKNSNIYRRNMKPSAFAQLVDPSLIKFKGSNLHRVPGYGCYWV